MNATVTAPDGGRIHDLIVSVNPMRPWEEALEGIGSCAQNETSVRKIGGHYPPQDDGTRECNVVLVNFGKTIPTGQEALAWAKLHNLSSAKPRVVFAIGEHKQCLPDELGLPDLAIASTELSLVDGQNQVCSLWYIASDRYVFNVEFDDVWNEKVWFAFENDAANST